MYNVQLGFNSAIMYDVQLGFNTAIMQRHVDQLRYRPNTNDIYEKDCSNNHDICKNSSSY